VADFIAHLGAPNMLRLKHRVLSLGSRARFCLLLVLIPPPLFVSSVEDLTPRYQVKSHPSPYDKLLQPPSCELNFNPLVAWGSTKSEEILLLRSSPELRVCGRITISSFISADSASLSPVRIP
jgi:hypothetical protein